MSVLWPRTPPPLNILDMREALANPVGRPQIRDLCRGKSRPVIIIDDLSRPTPGKDLVPLLLAEFRECDIPAENVTIVLATGTHSEVPLEQVSKKVGAEAMAQCRVISHNDQRGCVLIGKTSFGTPILVNEMVHAADFVIGIGGIYPNHTAGFGGGAKLALGVLGRESITHLHYKHDSAGWGHFIAGQRFRCDLDEIAQAIGLHTMISLHVDAEGAPVRIVCGDYRLYYDDAVRFARENYSLPTPSNCDVVVSNAYPGDATLLGARMKGSGPLNCCPPGASRILLASCYLGAGHHGLFPLGGIGAFEHARRVLSVREPRLWLAKVTKKFHFLSLGRRQPQKSQQPRLPVLLFRPGSGPKPPLPTLSGLSTIDRWADVVANVRVQQAGKDGLRVLVYPCASLQVLESPAVPVNELPEALARASKE